MPDHPACPSWDAVLAALLGELPDGESARARAHLAGCPSCARLAKLHADLEQARLSAAASSEDGCPSPEALAAWAAGDAEAPGGEAIEAHLAGCPACRWAVSESPDDAAPAGPAAPVPARLLARARSVWQRWHPAHALPVSPASGAPVPTLRRAAPWAMVAASAAAGMLGGVVAVRWLGPAAPAPSHVPAVAQAAPVAAPDAAKDLARRQGALEARTADLERRPDGDAAAAGVRELSVALGAVRRDLAALGDSVRTLPAHAPGALAKDAVPDLSARLARIQEELGRLDAGLAEVRQASAQSAKDLADARQAQDRTADRLRSLEGRSSVASATPPAAATLAAPPDFDTLLLAARQGSREEYQQALEILGAHKLDMLGYAVAYYSKDVPKDRRAQAGDELTRLGAKGVDRELILALVHGQPAVRREASALLSRHRTRGQDFGYNAAAAPEERQRAVLRAVRWWENEYRDDFPEKAQIQQGVVIVIPVVPVRPGPGTAAPPASPPPTPMPPPPQYAPPK